MRIHPCRVSIDASGISVKVKIYTLAEATLLCPQHILIQLDTIPIHWVHINYVQTRRSPQQCGGIDIKTSKKRDTAGMRVLI